MVFNLLLAVTLVVGLVWPSAGIRLSEVRDELIVTVMFLMALTLPGGRLRRAIGNWKGLCACAAAGYVLLPALCWVAARVAFPGDVELAAGMAILGALPCTLASAAVWTRLGGGDDALALVYTVVSNVAAVGMAPLVLYLSLGKGLEIPASVIVTGLVKVVLIPVVAGQLARVVLGKRVDRAKPVVSVIARGLVLGIVLIAAAKMSARVAAEPTTALAVVGVSLVLHVAALGAAHALARFAGLPGPERTAVLFAGSQKTLFVGVYLAGAHFPDQPFALLPIAAYHAVQLLVDTVLASRLARRAEPDAT